MPAARQIVEQQNNSRTEASVGVVLLNECG